MKTADALELEDSDLPESPPKNKPAPRAPRSGKKLVIRSSRRMEREALAVFLLAVASFMFLALISYQPQDPSLNTAAPAHAPIANIAGLIGSYFADVCLQIFGVSAFVLPIGLCFLSIMLFAEKIPRIDWTRWLGLGVLTILTATLLRFYGKSLTLFSREFPTGGLVGEVLSSMMLRGFNRVGALVLLIGGVLATFIVVTRLSLSKTLQHALAAVYLVFRGLKPLGEGIANASLGLVDKAKQNPRLAFLWTPRAQRLSNEEREGPSSWNRRDARLDDEEIEPEMDSREVLHHAELVEDEFEEEEDDDDEQAELPRAAALAKDGPKIVTKAKQETKAPRIQEALSFQSVDHEYQLPSVDMLHMELEKPKPVDEWSLRMNSKILEKKLLDYGVEGKVVEIHPGPVITMYEFEPAPGVKVGKIVNLSDDLSLSMGGRSVRIVAPIPGKPVVGIEIPNHNREIVTLFEIASHPLFLADQGLTLALGKDTEGEPVVANLAKMPHLLVAGATGTGKSVSINAMICSLLMRSNPDRVRFLMIDPKMVELPMYEGIPHLLLPVITDPKKASVALKWAVVEMERRLKLLAQAGTRNIDNFNKKAAAKHNEPAVEEEEVIEGEEGVTAEEQMSPESKMILNRHGQLPYIVIIIDELADLMMIAGREIEESITRLAQMARAAGIHLIVATQRPSVDVITGLIKANFPARISFKVFSRIDSRTILDCIGSEALLGDGDMLFIPPGSTNLRRIHGAYVTENEVIKVVDFLKKQGKPQYEESILETADTTDGPEGEEEEDELYQQAVEVVAQSGQASVSYVQRRLRIGYNRAARIVEMMEKQGVVGPADGVKPREIFISKLSD